MTYNTKNMNRQIIYSIIGLLFCGISLISCDKDDFSRQENKEVANTEDTDVPEGYVRVSFPETEAVQTRAMASGPKDAIANLWYLRYKKVGEDFILDKKDNPIHNTDWGTVTTWPFKYTDDMKIGETYKVVFLGNMDKRLFGSETGNDLLTGVNIGDNFNDARINAPVSGFSSGKVFYFCCPNEFTATKTESSSTMNVPVTLKRLVSRLRLTTYGIPSEVQSTVSSTERNYDNRFYASWLEDAHPMKLGERIFNDATGALGSQFREQLKKDIIFPVAYMLEQNGKLTSTNAPTVYTWYTSVKDSYWSNYTVMTTANMQTYLKDRANSSGYYNDVLSASGMPESLCQFIEALYTGNGSYVTNMLNQIKTENIKQYQSLAGGNLKTNGSFTIAKQQVVAALKAAEQQRRELVTWDHILNNGTIKVGLEGTAPQTLDFNLDVKETQNLSLTQMDLLPGSLFEDRMLEIQFLGYKTGTANWNIVSLHYSTENDIPLPGTTFPTGISSPNSSRTYRISPSSMTLNAGKDETATPDRICYSYGKLITNLGTYPDKLDASKLDNIFCDALAAVYGIARTLIDLNRDYGLIRDPKSTGSFEQYGVDFYVPDFTSPNFAISMEWKEENE